MSEDSEFEKAVSDMTRPQGEMSLLDTTAEPIGGVPIQRVRPRHNAIMDFILANPTVQMQHVAAHFEVSASWLSIIINSDCFVAQMREKQEEMFHEMLIPLGEKLTGVAHLAIEKLGKKIETSEDASFILDSTDKIFKNLGYGNKGSASLNVTVGEGSQVAIVNQDVLKQARERMYNKHSTPAVNAPVERLDEGLDLPHKESST